ncbi:MAG: ATP-grasp domain-containing protein [Anaplasmataceae bacterium]|nr:ATP-grasp domain-containing protein [Anaplasmataceae bacterium]
MQSVLVANRGDIACRIFKTLKKMGIRSVAVYSDADKNSLHKQMADEAIYIGASPASQSYLNIDKIINIVKEHNIDGIHPGFGFLSENYSFVERLEINNISFIGPHSEAIKNMGDKIIAKEIAEKVGVNTIKGFIINDISDINSIKEEIDKIGYPIIIKAAAGGGGKGMRILYDANKLEDEIIMTSTEAEKHFGDKRIFVEKFIEKPRHIEIQVIADKYDNVICLGERECSIQRRNQKVIEEAPSPYLSNKTRELMYKQSKELARYVGYYSVGTVEYIVDQEENFYFLEMNTRIQVEHPVTELITGLDLVELMINIENGEILNFKQEDVKLNGHAIEARIYAEDPTNNFIPSIGHLMQYYEPSGENLRIDSGIIKGNKIDIYYDPMIAKISGFGKNRNEAIAVLKNGLNKYLIDGVDNNIPFLNSIINHQDFIEGKTYTDFIKLHYNNNFNQYKFDNNIREIYFVIISSYLYNNNEYKLYNNIEYLTKQIISKIKIANNEYKKFTISMVEYNHGQAIYEHNNNTYHLIIKNIISENLYTIDINDTVIDYQIYNKKTFYKMIASYVSTECQTLSKKEHDMKSLLSTINKVKKINQIKSPLNGLIVKIMVKVGDKINEKMPLFSIESMKMENTIYAETNGIISEIPIKKGDIIKLDDILLKLK